MSQLTVRCVNRKLLRLDERSAFSTDAALLANELSLAAVRTGEEIVVLNTCERFEVYYGSHDSLASELIQTAGQKFESASSIRGEAALRHLFRVASGLESRILGEEHVLGQVRAALNHAAQPTISPGIVARAFSYAIRCGRHVRARTSLGVTTSGYVDSAVQRLREELGSLEHRHIAVVGTGAMAKDIGRALTSVGVDRLTIVGRHAARTETVAQTLGARWLTLDTWHNSIAHADAIVTAVAASAPTITVDFLNTCHTRLFVDLGAAPNVDPAIDSVPGVRVFRLEDLGSATSLVDAVTEAEAMVEQELARYLCSQATRIWKPTTANIRQAS